ncbi:MAG: SMC family ATPase [Bacteroidia bacterium]|nr:SMC family ATPase [Bacteroidia bacterium]
MQLRKLSVQGFYSYVERQELDFAPLLEAGLSGIIGNTGAGKSALLEAILLALFGKAPRVHRSPLSVVSKWKKPQETAKVELTFTLKGQLYQAQCEVFSRSSEKGLWQINSDLKRHHLMKSTEDLLGISYMDFITAILLPQGQFDGFLNMGATERHTLLLRLFNLNIIDKMSSVVSDILKEEEDKLKEAESKIAAYEDQIKKLLGDFTEPLLRSKIEEHTQKKTQVESQIKEVSEALKEWNLKKSFYDLWEAAEKFYNQNKAKYEEYEQERNRLLRLETLREDLLPFYHQWKAQQDEVQRLKKQLQNEETLRAYLENQLKELERRYKEWEKLNQELPTLQKEKQQLEKIDQLIRLKQEIKMLQERLEQKQTETSQLEQKHRETQERINSILQDIQGLTQEIYLLQELDGWYKMLHDLSKRLNTQRERYQQNKGELSPVEDLIRQSYGDLLREFPKKQEEKWMEWLNRLQEELNGQLRALLERQQAAALAQGLKPGQPCPVCGASSHPNPACLTPEQESQLKHLEQLLEKLREPSLKTYLSKADNLARDLQNIKGEVEKEEQEYKAFQAKLPPQAQERGYIGDLSEKQKVEQALRKNKEMLAQREREKNVLTKEAERQQRDLTVRQGELEQVRSRLAYLQGQEQSIESDIQDLSWLAKEESERKARLDCICGCLARHEELQKQQISSKYHEVGRRLEVVRQNCQNLREKLSQIQDTLQELYQKMEDISQKSGLSAEESIEKVINGYEKIQQAKAEIEDFMTKWKENENKRKEYEPKGASYDANRHEADRERYKQLESERDRLTQEISTLRERLNQVDYLEEVREKEKAELDGLRPRVQALKDLNDLLSSRKRAKSFRSYVLKSYVERLISQANQYLQSWTNGFLELRVPSLEESSGLEIEVVDKLAQLRQNDLNKISREVRTLSGGQTFMVSLALALALSDELRARSNLDRNTPLFIDEGFGTLDNETLDQVVDTLRRLARSGRPICIITHRTELKEKLDAYVEVGLHPEKGSILRTSWAR